MYPVETQWNSKVSLQVLKNILIFQYTYKVEERLLEWLRSLWFYMCHSKWHYTATTVYSYAVLQGIS